MVVGQFWRSRFHIWELLLQSIYWVTWKAATYKEYARVIQAAFQIVLPLGLYNLAFPLVLGILVGKTPKENHYIDMQRSGISHAICSIELHTLQINNSLCYGLLLDMESWTMKHQIFVWPQRWHCPGRPLKLQGRAGPVLGWSRIEPWVHTRGLNRLPRTTCHLSQLYCDLFIGLSYDHMREYPLWPGDRKVADCVSPVRLAWNVSVSAGELHSGMIPNVC